MKNITIIPSNVKVRAGEEPESKKANAELAESQQAREK
jgi:hypothetical protein